MNLSNSESYRNLSEYFESRETNILVNFPYEQAVDDLIFLQLLFGTKPPDVQCSSLFFFQFLMRSFISFSHLNVFWVSSQPSHLLTNLRINQLQSFKI